MLHVAPIGKTKRVTLLSSFRLDSQHSIVVGNVAALKYIEKVVYNFELLTTNRMLLIGLKDL